MSARDMQKAIAHQPSPLYMSYETMRKLFTQLDRYELTNRRWGRRVANRTRQPRGAGVQVYRPLERTEIDHFLLDIHLVDNEGQLVGRPYLTAIIDSYSRMILGYALSLKTPNAVSVLSTIRHAMSLKPPIKVDRQALGLSLDDLPLEQELHWEVAGMMSQVVMDNGGDFMSLSVRTGLNELGIEVQFCPPREPSYKGIIERFGRTLNMKLIHWLPGTTYGKPMRDYDYDGRDHACLTLGDLRQRIELAFWSYNRTPHKGVGKRTPLEVWREGVAQWPILLPPENSLRFTAALSLTDERTLHRYGIEFDGEFFNSDELGALWNRMPKGSKVMIKIESGDINYIYVVDPANDEAFKVPNKRPREEKVSWGLQKAIKKRGKALGLDPQAHEKQLAKTLARASRRPPAKKPKPGKQPPGALAVEKTAEPQADSPFTTRKKAEPAKGFDPVSLFTSKSER